MIKQEIVSSIAAIGTDMPQPREAADDLSEHQWCTIAVLDVSSVDHRVDQIALGVGQDVALAPLDLFACIVTPRPAAFRDFDTLTVEYSGTGRRLAAGPTRGLSRGA